METLHEAHLSGCTSAFSGAGIEKVSLPNPSLPINAPAPIPSHKVHTKCCYCFTPMTAKIGGGHVVVCVCVCVCMCCL